MGIFAFLSQKMANHRLSKHQTKQTDSVTSNETPSTRTSKHQKKDKNSKKKLKHTSSIASTATDASCCNINNQDIIESYMAAKNRHASAEELLQFWSSDQARVKFDDHDGMTAKDLILEIQNCFEAFQDLHFKYDSIEEAKPGEVFVEGLVVTGTHTGDLKFADFPVLPKTGKHIVLDEERLLFYFKDGKIIKMVDFALGNLTGPPGMYIAVGGKLEKPQ